MFVGLIIIENSGFVNIKLTKMLKHHRKMYIQGICRGVIYEGRLERKKYVDIKDFLSIELKCYIEIVLKIN